MATHRHNPCLFLLPKPASQTDEHGEQQGLECTKIDLITHTKTQITFFPNPSRGVSELFVDGHACVSYGPLVLIIGGYSASGSGGIHIFNTAIRQWTPGPNMLFPRGSFAWGVIRNQLYIAGGIGPSGNVKETEVYDFETGELWAVAALPASMAVDIFFSFPTSCASEVGRGKAEVVLRDGSRIVYVIAGIKMFGKKIRGCRRSSKGFLA